MGYNRKTQGTFYYRIHLADNTNIIVLKDSNEGLSLVMGSSYTQSVVLVLWLKYRI